MGFEKELEIRGVNRSDILNYLQELGGKYEPDGEHDIYRHETWTCFVSSESSFRFMHSNVPVVKVLFTSHSEESLAEILKAFRLKTFRAGG